MVRLTHAGDPLITRALAAGYPPPGQRRPLVVSDVSRPAPQPRQRGDVGGDAPGLVAGEQLRRRAASRFILEIDVGERLPVVVADDEAGVGLVDDYGLRPTSAAPVRAGDASPARTARSP